MQSKPEDKPVSMWVVVPALWWHIAIKPALVLAVICLGIGVLLRY